MHKRINWDEIAVVIEPTGDTNPNNPHAAASPQERTESLRSLARQILLRRVQRIAQN